MNPRMCGRDEAFEEGMRLVWFAMELGMELAGEVKRMSFQLNDFDQFAIRRVAAKSKSSFFELLAISIVKLVAMAMAFIDDKCAVQMGGFAANHKLTCLGAETHGAAFFGDALLVVEHGDHRVRAIEIELGGMGFV